jgi:S-adenosylmethionine decarboxylase
MMGKSAGLHVLMDAYVADDAVFTKEKIEELFARLVTALDMKALAPAHIYEVPVDPEVLRRVQETGVFEDEGGITGVVVISTSHMAIHCWPLQRKFSLCVFSCKDFSAATAQALIYETLHVTTANARVIERFFPG